MEASMDFGYALLIAIIFLIILDAVERGIHK